MVSRTTRPLKPLALALALAALAVPTAQGHPVPLVTEHSAGQNGTGQPSTAQSVPLITEHSAGQNGTGQPSTAQSVPLITEHSAGQNGTGQPSTAQSVPFITEHSAGQNGTSQPDVVAASPNGFKWRDAGVGAGVAFAAMLLAVGVATLITRRSRGRLAGV
jgi:hypothetical protein